MLGSKAFGSFDTQGGHIMKIEKINDNQIRCTLTSADLSSRKIKLSELTYGSEKARNLFYDMINQAHNEFGFETNGIPLMIEAVPKNDSLVLNITKVSDPEELDTRFSSFSTPQSSSANELHLSGADGILNIMKKIKEATEKALSGQDDKKTAAPSSEAPLKGDKPDAEAVPENLIEAFRFSSLDDVISAAKAVKNTVNSKNSLYKYETDAYLLILHCSQSSPENLNRICNILSEYGFSDHCSEASENYLREHGYLMIADKALQKLADI